MNNKNVIMKKIIISLSLLLALPFLFAKEIYMDESSNKEYLFLGSMNTHQKKWLDLENNTIVWIDNNQLQRQSNQLTPGEFLEKLFESKLVFHVNGAKPYWNATVSKNKLQISHADGTKAELAIQIDLNKNPIDGVFLLMFQSEDHRTYGVIRKLWRDTPCDISISDEASIFEVFINHQGNIGKGCATLDKMY